MRIFFLILSLYFCFENNLISGITNIENDRLILDNASLELYGDHSYKRISLINSSTLYIKFSALSANGWGSLELTADTIYIDGTSMINGKGKGGVTEGLSSSALYGSGGSYGGLGGRSGFSASVQSTAFGDNKNLYDLSQGEKGANGYPDGSYFSGLGGYGGGKLILNCTVFTLNGIINLSGENGQDCIVSSSKVGGGGGGAGGGCGIIAKNFSGSGSIYAIGGNGGNGNGDSATRTNYGGGGGAGGRVIIAYNYLSFNTNNIFINGGTGGNSTNAVDGQPGENGSLHITKIPDSPVIISPADNGDSLNPPVFKFKALANDSDKLYYKIELSDNNFISYTVFNQYTNQIGWNKNNYESGETAVFTLPYTLESGKIYKWRVYAFDGSVFSEPSEIYSFKCGNSVSYKITPGENNNEPKILTLNNDGINDYVKFNVDTTENFKIIIYNIYGEKIKELSINQNEWDGKDSVGNYVESGAYIVQIQIGNKISSALVNVIK